MPGEHKPLTDLLFAFFKEISQKGKFIASFQWTVTQKKKKKSLTILQLSSDFMRNEKFYPRVTHCSQIRAPSAINISSSRQNNCLIWRFIDLSASLFFFFLWQKKGTSRKHWRIELPLDEVITLSSSRNSNHQTGTLLWSPLCLKMELGWLDCQSHVKLTTYLFSFNARIKIRGFFFFFGTYIIIHMSWSTHTTS